jgi:hypothetical protein
LINYADKNMTISQEKNKLSALKNGVHQVIPYNESHISYDFYKMNKEVLDAERGCGFWQWKPYVIMQTMLDPAISEGDTIIYSDSGIEFTNSVYEIINRMTGDYFFFTNGFINAEWSKMNILETICPGKWNMEQTQVQASLIFFRVNKATKDFVKTWLMFCQIPGLIDDSPSPLPNVPTFADNRHDQSCLTAMCIREGIDYNNLWCDEIWSNQRYRWPHCTYPPILKHHRRRNNEY